MPMTEEERAFVKETAWEVGAEVSAQLKDAMAAGVRQHAADCKIERMQQSVAAGGAKSGKFWKIFSVLVAFGALVVAVMVAIHNTS